MTKRKPIRFTSDISPDHALLAFSQSDDDLRKRLSEYEAQGTDIAARFPKTLAYLAEVERGEIPGNKGWDSPVWTDEQRAEALRRCCTAVTLTLVHPDGREETIRAVPA